jgi:molecular chaperone DnaJ
MVKKYHPDNNQGDKAAEEKFKEINEAYGVLSDAEKKAQYDRFGHATDGMGMGAGSGSGFSGFSGFEGFGSGFGGGPRGGQGAFTGFEDLADILSGMAGFGGGSRSRGRGPVPGNDVEATVQVDFMDSVNGTTKDVTLNIRDTCDTCKGTGAKSGTVPENCRACSGTGQVRQTVQTPLGVMETASACRTCGGKGKTIKDKCASCAGNGKSYKPRTVVVKVPKGIENGQHIKYSGQGEAGDVGAPKGDLFVRILVTPHKLFKRRGNNLYMDKAITFAQAALGTDIVLETPYGDLKQTIPPGTGEGSVLTLKGRGMPHVGVANRTGDLLVTLRLQVPQNLTETQKELLAKFAAETGEDIENLGNKKSAFRRRKNK